MNACSLCLAPSPTKEFTAAPDQAVLPQSARTGVFRTVSPIASGVRSTPFRVDRVAIVDHESMCLVALDDHPKLLRGPVRGRMRRHVPMQNPPGADFEHHEHVENPERGGNDDEEITREHASAMVTGANAFPLACSGSAVVATACTARTVRGDTWIPGFTKSSLAMCSSPHA